MAHLQQQILDALKTVLVAGDTDAGERVYLDRMDPLRAKQLPAIVVQEGEAGDDVQPATIGGVQQRTLEVEIVCALKSCDDVAAQAREFGLAVEKLVAPATTASLATLCKGGWRLTNSRLERRGEGEEAVAARIQSWQFTYFARRATPDALA